MVDDQHLRALIKREIELGRGRHETFENIGTELDFGDGFSPRLVTQWFKAFDGGHLEKVPEQWKPVVEAICKAFQSERKGPDALKCPQLDWCHLCILSTRYSLDFKVESDKPDFYLFDNSYGRKEKLQIDEDLPPSPNYHLFSLNFPNFLLIPAWFDEDDEESDLEICLLQINLVEMKVKLLDKKRVAGYFQYFIVDSDDRRRFVLYVNGLDSKYVQKCEVVEDELKMEDKVLDEDDDLSGLFLKYQGNKISAVVVNQDNEDRQPMFPFTEWTLTPDGLKKRHICDVKMEDQFDVNDYFFNQQHVWLQNTCYSLLHYNVGQTWMYKFDLEKREMIKLRELEIDYMSSVFIDKTTLTVCTKNQRKNEHKWHRFMFGNQPDTLLNLALKFVGQKTMHLEEQQFKSFLEQLPKDVRPFGRIS